MTVCPRCNCRIDSPDSIHVCLKRRDPCQYCGGMGGGHHNRCWRPGATLEYTPKPPADRPVTLRQACYLAGWLMSGVIAAQRLVVTDAKEMGKKAAEFEATLLEQLSKGDV